jgi:hypothetical protein
MGWFDDFLHPERAYQKAQDTSSQYFDQAQAGLNPYNQMGQQAGGSLQEMMQKFMNPGQLENEWSQGYEMSPYAQQQMGLSKQSGLDAASSMGLMGSSAAVNNIQNQAGNIMQQDREKYMKDLMEKYMAGMGIGQNMYNQGGSAAGQMSQNAMNQGNNMAGMEYNKNAAGANMFGDMLGKGASMFGSVFGGPMGGALGNWAGNWLGGKLGNQQNWQTGNRF